MALLKARFDSKWIADENGCWVWTDALSGAGYGYLAIGGRAGGKKPAHRVGYELYVGPIPDGLQIDHLCRNRACVNPAHLEAVDQRTNLLRGATITARNAAVTRCPAGHAYIPANTIRYRGKRRCRTCANDQRRARRRKVA